jgi:hypothetical protein
MPKAGGMREEKTQLGRAPTQPEGPRSGGVREEPKDLFGQDGLEERGEMARPTRSQDSKSGVFEAPRREAPRSTGERPALKNRPQEGTEDGTRFDKRPPGTSERPRVETPRRGTESPRPEEGADFEKRPPGTGERPRVETPRRGTESPRPEEGAGFEKRAPNGTGERPRLETAQRGTEVPRQAEGTDFEKRAPNGTSERPQLPGGPKVSEGAEARPLEELVPEFPEPIGEEALAHHFAEELRYLGPELRPARMPPSTRAERLWAFFKAYAEANAKDPAGQSAEGRELFRKALNGHGYAALRDANSGRNGVQTALAMLDSKSLEELHAKLADVHIEPGPSRLSSEVSIPVQQHPTQPEMPAVVVDPSAFEMPKEAQPKDTQPKAVQSEAQPKDAQPKDAQPKDAQPKDAQPKDAQPKDVQSKDAQPKEAQPKDTREVKDSQPRPAPETPERPASPKKTSEQQPVFDQKEKLASPPPQTGVQPPVMGMQGTMPPLTRVDAQRMGLDPEEEKLQAERGTSKRLGANMLWNALHGVRDLQDSAVEQENWNRMAFGTIFALVGAALLIAMLVSL